MVKFLSPYLYTIVAVVLIIGGYFYGQAKKDEGLALGQKQCAERQAEATDDALKDRERIYDEVKKIDDIDAALIRLGIMRRTEDR